MNKVISEGEVCERLLDNEDFKRYQDMIKEKLANENRMYKAFSNQDMSPMKEYVVLKQFQSVINIMEKVINLPKKKKDRAKIEKKKQKDSQS